MQWNEGAGRRRRGRARAFFSFCWRRGGGPFMANGACLTGCWRAGWRAAESLVPELPCTQRPTHPTQPLTNALARLLSLPPSLSWCLLCYCVSLYGIPQTRGKSPVHLQVAPAVHRNFFGIGILWNGLPPPTPSHPHLHATLTSTPPLAPGHPHLHASASNSCSFTPR